MTLHRVGPKGQVVIPKQIRDELDIRPGDEVTFAREADGVTVRRRRGAISLRGRFADSPLLADLMADRDEERARERSA